MRELAAKLPEGENSGNQNAVFICYARYIFSPSVKTGVLTPPSSEGGECYSLRPQVNDVTFLGGALFALFSFSGSESARGYDRRGG